MPPALAAVVLTGGRSRRMGRDKATIVQPGPSGAATLVEHVVAALSACCHPVLVVAAVGQVLPSLPATVLRDETSGAGPLVATGRGLRAAAVAGATHAFVCATDMPSMSAALVGELMAPGHPDADAVIAFDGRDHYLAAVYRTALAGLVDELVGAGAASMRALADAIDVRRVTVAHRDALVNLNTPADLR